MSVDTTFPELDSRVRDLERQLSAVEITMQAEGGSGASTVYIAERYRAEIAEIRFLLRFYQRATNGALSRRQWSIVAASMAISCALLILLVLQRWP